MLLQEWLVETGESWVRTSCGGVWVCMVGGGALQDPRVVPRGPGHNVAGDLLRGGSLEYDRRGLLVVMVVVYGSVVAAVGSRRAAVGGRLLRQTHVTELGVEGVGL